MSEARTPEAVNWNEVEVKILYGSNDPEIRGLCQKYVQEAHGLTEERLRVVWLSYRGQLRALLRKRGIFFGDEVDCQSCG